MDQDNHWMRASESSMRTIGELTAVLTIRDNAVQGAYDEALKHAAANLATKKEIVELQEHLLKTISDQKRLIKSNESSLAAIASYNSDLRELVHALQAKVDAQRVEADLLREELALAKQGAVLRGLIIFR